MTSDAPLPVDLRQWVAPLQLRGLATVEDVSWPRDNSQVWRVTSDAAEAYVKISPTRQDFAREVHAYYHAAIALGPDEAPRLLATEPDLRAILTTPVAGVITKNLSLSIEQEVRVHELAGRLLGQWQGQQPSRISESARDEAIQSVTDRANHAVAQLEQTGHLLTDAQRAIVEQACRELPHLATTLPLAFRHGDFQPRNWVWDTDRGTVALLDFEKASYGIAVEDFMWLFATTWPVHPHLKSACLAGFGRQLDDTEYRALTLFTALAAMSYVNAGITLRDQELVTKAQVAFGHLCVASH